MRSSSGGHVKRPASGLSCSSSTGGVMVCAMSSVGMAGNGGGTVRTMETTKP